MDCEELCRPVFICFCDYWQLNQAGFPPSAAKFREDIEAALEDAKLRAAKDPVLSRDYERIERPLVFFIDFMVKEGEFPFKGDWRELGRDYNELSGDEKFFNILSDALKDGKAQNTIPLFYTMLGLGFEGAYRDDHGFIEKTMNECVARLPGELDIREEPVVQVALEKRTEGTKKGGTLRPLRMILTGSVIFLVAALIFNFAVFFDVTLPFRKNLSGAAVQVRETQALPAQSLPQEVP
jgi:type VI protein secretion system component VasF